MVSPLVLKITRNAELPLRLRKKLGKLLGHEKIPFELPVFGGVYGGQTGNNLDYKVYMYGCHEAPTIRLIRDLLKLKDQSTYMDVGANTGLHIVATKDCWSRCIGFEPNPHVLELLQQNLVLNQLTNVVRLLPCGLSDRDADLPFEFPVDRNLGEGRFVDAETGTMLHVRVGDDVCQAEGLMPDVIKIDVEGHERQVLLGLRKTLRLARPAVIFEYNQHSREDLNDPAVLADLFGDGYSFWGILRSREYPKLVPFNPSAKYENILAWHGDLFNLKRYM